MSPATVRNHIPLVSRWKLITISVLSAIPILLILGFGAWALYRSGAWFWLWWTLPVCWGLSALLARLWARDLQIEWPELDKTHWTPQDEAAMAIVAAEQARVAEIPANRLTDPQFYTALTQDLAIKIARHYRPTASDPLGDRTVVEILAAVQLIADDVETCFIKYVPASHLVTVAQWRLLSHAPAWWETTSAVTWIASIAVNPLNLGRYLASRMTMQPLTQQLQQHLLGAFYTLFVRQAGYHLIELNSGRLRSGSRRYREVMGKMHAPEVPPGTAPPAAPVSAASSTTPLSITIAVIGQVKAGKSSLVNCLLGGQQAVTDILPATRGVSRYQLTWPERHEQLVLLDTPGYADAGATAAELRETAEAVRQADLTLLVLDARSPAREADLLTLTGLEDWFKAYPQFKPPRIIIVLNKIDGLSPVLEWKPPYQWQTPTSAKERNIAAAIEYAREVFAERAVNYVPVCADWEQQRQTGIKEDLIPAMSRQLDGARATSLLRGLHVDFEQGRVRQVVGQVLEAGKRILDSI